MGVVVVRCESWGLCVVVVRCCFVVCGLTSVVVGCLLMLFVGVVVFLLLSDVGGNVGLRCVLLCCALVVFVVVRDVPLLVVGCCGFVFLYVVVVVVRCWLLVCVSLRCGCL